MLRTSRVEGWHTALNKHIEENRNTVHSYDKATGLCCARFTAGGRFAVSGIKYPVIEKAKYKTEIGAAAYIRKNGCTTVEELADKTLGPRVPISFAAAGDAVLADLAEMGLTGGIEQIGLTLGLCNGAFSYFVGETGLVEVRTLDLKACYYG